MQPTLHSQQTSNKQQTRDLSKRVPWCLLAAVWLLKPMWNMSSSQSGLSQAGACNQSGLETGSHHERSTNNQNSTGNVDSSSKMQPTLNSQQTSDKQQTRDLFKMVFWCLLAAVWMLKPMLNKPASQSGLSQAGAWNQSGLETGSHH